MSFNTSFLILFASLINYCSYAQQAMSVPQENGASKEILLLPYYIANNDTSLKEVKEIRVGRPNKPLQDFNTQLKDIAAQTVKAGGNVFQITEMLDHDQSGVYKIFGTVYHTDKYEETKVRALAQEKKLTDDGQYALLTIYRPVYNRGYNDELPLNLIINDTLQIQLKAKAKYFIKIRKDGKQIKAGDMMVYLKNYQPYFEIMDELQGSLESSLVNNFIISKKL